MMALRAASFKLLPLSLLVAAALAACGGGGSAPASAPNPTPPSSTTVFAEASGALCANKIGADCVEPTSSGATQTQLLATLSDPQGPTVRMARYGYTISSHTKSVGGAMVEGSYNYDSVEKPVIFGRNQIVLDGKTYVYTSTLTNGTLEFQAGGTDKVTIPSLLTDNAVAFSQGNLISSVTGANTPDETIKIDNASWSAFFGVLTDKLDANPPSDNKMQYKGTVSFVGGNGAPFAGSKFLDVVSTFCPITLDFDAASGTLSTTATSCTDSRGTVLNFSLKDLMIKDSRVFGSVGDEARGAANGPSSSGDPTTETVPAVALTFTSTKIGGAVFGKSAQIIGIQGSGALGLFSVTAFRQ